MKTKLIILGLLISSLGFGQVYSLDGGGTGTPTDTNSLSARIDLKLDAADTASLSGRIDAIDVSTYVTQDALVDSAFVVAGDLTGYATETFVTEALDTLSLGFDEVTTADSVVMVNDGALSVMSAKTFVFNTDTIKLYDFGTGGGVAGDTTLMAAGVYLGGSHNETTDTLVITKVFGSVLGAATDTLSAQIYIADTLGQISPTEVFAAARGFTKGGNSYTSFSNAKIAPGKLYYAKISGVTAARKPELVIITMYGYRIRNY